MSLTTYGERERVKLTVHAVMLMGAATCGVYNAVSWIEHRETHNAVNAIVYGALVCLEVVHVQHHWDALQDRLLGPAPGFPRALEAPVLQP